MARASFRHVPQLDGMRALAISIVFVAHCGLERIVPGGLGVTLFFFLSGYLITSLLRSEMAQTGRVDLAAFYMRRTLRIWPPLYITVLLAWVACVATRLPQAVEPSGVAGQLLFVTNYAGELGLGPGLPAMPLWSLAVEEHFYLVFPLLFALLARRRPAFVAALCAIVCAAVLALRVAISARGGDLAMIYYWSHTRIDSILFGCILALWNNPALDEDAFRPRAWHAVAALAVLLFCLLLRDEVFRQTLRYTLQGLALIVLFSFVLWDEGPVARLLSSPPAVLIARYSYTFYLCHMFILDVLLDRYAPMPIAGRFVVGGGLSLGYCALMYRFVERPLARRRRASHRVDKTATSTA